MLTDLNVRELRDDLGESQQVFAARFGVTQTAVSLWEKKGPPTRGLVRQRLESLRKGTSRKAEQGEAA